MKTKYLSCYIENVVFRFDSVVLDAAPVYT
jgi:hypothetical protein